MVEVPTEYIQAMHLDKMFLGLLKAEKEIKTVVEGVFFNSTTCNQKRKKLLFVNHLQITIGNGKNNIFAKARKSLVLLEIFIKEPLPGENQ